MPELPEVETVRRGLEPVMTGHRIARADVRRPDLRWPFPKDMEKRLTGAGVLRLRRRGKYILADLSTDETLLIHLGMSGRMLISGASTADHVRDPAVLDRHDHVVFHMDQGPVITFNDARRFGAMDLVPTNAWESHLLLQDMGPEPLGNAFDAGYLQARLTGRRAPIKAALLDQRVVAGLGNIYVCEALYRAGIHPARAAGRIGSGRLADLVVAIRDILNEAIAAGGSSLRDHRQATGELGYFQHGFAVYDRAEQPCARPECSGTIHRIVQSGRSSFYCPQCQR